ncbi:MAG: efflux RND transporter periplasmic adaptor subunit [Bacteroidia bacterium]
MNDSIALPVLAFFLFFFSCNNKKEAISPEIKDISESVYASGILKTVNQYEVFTKVSGVVGKIAVKEGASVKKGDLLFEIENPNASISSDNAKLTAEANDYAANAGKLNDALNAIELAQKNLQNATLMCERQKNLWAQNIGTKVELEQKELGLEKSKLVWKQAKVAYSDLKRQLELASNQSKNNLKIARFLESDLLIRSAVDGIVYKINIERGELATSMVPMAVIGGENFVIELDIDEFDIVKIKKGQRVIISMDSYKSQVFEALVSNIYPMMNERTRTFKVEAVFSKKPAVLYPNLTLEANIIIHEKQNALTIPTGYLLSDSTVMLEDGSVQKVKIGLKDYNLTEIVSGINANSKIIMPKK